MAQKITGVMWFIFRGLFFERNTEIGQKDHFRMDTTYNRWYHLDMFEFVYQILWEFIYLVCAPFGLLLRKKRLLERLALNLPHETVTGKNIWIHALSVGEVISALPLVDTLGREFPDNGIVFTVTTAKGKAVAQKELNGKVSVLLTRPIDSWTCNRRIVRYINPSVFLIIETDIWPGIIEYLQKRGIQTILINGRISPSTFKSYQIFSYFIQRMFKHVALCLMQSDLDRQRLIKVGVLPEKTITVGNIKFDREIEPMGKKERTHWLETLGFSSEDIIWVAGSTHPGEEEIVLDVHKRLCKSFSSLRLILAPRQIDQSNEIARKAHRIGLKAVLRSELTNERNRFEVIILNTIGELSRIYGLSSVSFVGGSLVPIGGHNLLEPAGFGCPVVFGDHTHNFVEMSERIMIAGGGLRVHNGAELYEELKQILSDSEMRCRMGMHAREFVKSNRGALGRIVTYIKRSMNASGGLL